MNPKFEYVLRLGDNALILGQRLAEWLGHAPALEEDIAAANVALDLIGQARLWLTYAGRLEGGGRDEDRLAYHREQHEFRNLTMLELPNGLSGGRDYAFTVVRRFLFDAWHRVLLEALSRSADAGIAAIASKSKKEADYHRRHSADWVVRLGDGTAYSNARAQDALDALWEYTGEFFVCDEVDRTMADSGEGVAADSLREAWFADVGATLAQATLEIPAPRQFVSRGKQGAHSEHLGYILAEMQVLQRAHPDATW